LRWMGTGMRDEAEFDIEELLRREGRRPIPEPRPDLVHRTLERVRGWILLHDVVRLLTLEGFWRSSNRADGDARTAEERQNSDRAVD